MIQTLRFALNSIELQKTPIVAGVGANSTSETIRLAHDAADAGANFVLVAVPGYYASVLKAHPAAIKKFFIDVAAASPVPVCVFTLQTINNLFPLLHSCSIIFHMTTESNYRTRSGLLTESTKGIESFIISQQSPRGST